jgi:hypothetical protein
MLDTLTFTVRIHDPREKKDAKLSTAWAAVEIPREDLKLSRSDFFAKHVAPAIEQLAAILDRNSAPALDTHVIEGQVIGPKALPAGMKPVG